MRFRPVPGLLAVIALATGCGSGDEGAVAGGDPSVEVVDAWARPTPEGATDAAIYLTIVNHGGQDDTVMGAQSSACEMAHLHATVMEDGVAGMDDAGSDGLVVPAGGELVLAPLGIHVMCMGVTDPFVSGDEFTVEVALRGAGWVKATGTVRLDGGS